MLGTSTPFPLSVANLRKFTGKGPRLDFLAFLARRSYSVENFDFNIKALDTTNTWTVAAGATATTWAVRGEAGGWIRGVHGTTAATSGLQLSLPTSYWTGASTAGMAVLYRSNIVAEQRIEIGFVNALPAVNTTIVNSLVTPTFNTAATAALWVYDHTGSTTTAGLYTDGSAVAAQKAAITTRLTVAATPHFVAVEVSGQTVRCWNGDSTTPTASLVSAVTAADALLPVVSVKRADTTDSAFDIDLIVTWSGRLG